MKNYLLPVILAHTVALTAFAQDDTSNQMQNAGYSITERGQHHRVWSRLMSFTNDIGAISIQTNNVTELATGMHRWASNRWVVATPEIVLTSTGIVARGAAHSAPFATNANTYAAVQARLSDGQILKSHVL